MSYLPSPLPEIDPQQDFNVVLAGNGAEGRGGHIRDALIYSALLGKSIRIESTQADQSGTGGLRSEHIVTVETLAFLCDAMVIGNLQRSQVLHFCPYEADYKQNLSPYPGLTIDLKGAASIPLIALLPYILFSHLSPRTCAGYHIPKEGIILTIKAGTLTEKAPSFHYVAHVLLPTLKFIGLAGHIELDRVYKQGWHTQSATCRGLLKAWVKPLSKPLPAFQLLQRGKLVKITAIATVPSPHLLMRGRTFGQILEEQFENVIPRRIKSSPRLPTVEITVNASNQPSQYHLFLSAHTISPESHLGYEQVYPQPDVFPPELELEGEERRCYFFIRACIKGLRDELLKGSAVDEHMADILTPYRVLAAGFSTIGLQSEAGATYKNGNLLKADIDEEFELRTASFGRKTSRWLAEETTGAKFKDHHGSYETCYGIGLGHGE
ncbi:uncharacterized protein RAG0_10821 [Rhynchosporium agropyri]|uniref:RNA 3'-terminal phosphate cyclase domain-containing protein n=1 Tax=Rhynchosporium agropyri TaxID=914238 RepID=A0A1E1L1D4_9HELO|nr:uncharacterized protein RAG0_10821 [Rhynchosporium agropyri]